MHTITTVLQAKCALWHPGYPTLLLLSAAAASTTIPQAHDPIHPIEALLLLADVYLPDAAAAASRGPAQLTRNSMAVSGAMGTP
jgi:hypothetical protein